MFFEDAIVANLSYSGFYWTPDLEQNAELRILFRCPQTPILITVSALRFLYKVTLHRDWCLEDIIPAPKRPQKLPIVLSPEEVLQFLSCVQSIKHRTILTVCYAAGLRISEAVRLKVADIDSERMVIRVEQGKGQKCCWQHFCPYVLVKFMLRWFRRCPPSEHLLDIDYT